QGDETDQGGETAQGDEPDLAAASDQGGEPDQDDASGAEVAASTENAPAPKPAPRDRRPGTVETIRDVERLVAQGRTEAAIQGILKLRRTYFPTSAYLAYLLGNLYFDKVWWSDGIDAYSDAIRLKRDFRSNATLNKNAI